MEIITIANVRLQPHAYMFEAQVSLMHDVLQVPGQDSYRFCVEHSHELRTKVFDSGAVPAVILAAGIKPKGNAATGTTPKNSDKPTSKDNGRIRYA